MTFWKITDTRMNCLISHQEIQALGYDLAELTQNQERTQEFLDILVKKGKEVLGINIDNGVQSFYGTFLPDKSLLLSISCGDIEEELDEEETADLQREYRLPLLPLEEGDYEGNLISYQILFPSLDYVIQFCQVFGTGKAAQSRLYEHDDIYYLVMEFENTEAGRNSANKIISAEEFGGLVEKEAISELFLKEHESCIIEEGAVEALCNTFGKTL